MIHKGNVRNWVMHILVMISVTALFACGSSSPNTRSSAVSSVSAKIVACPTTPTTAIAITNFAFQPASAAIAVNDIVKWTNNDTSAHTVTSGSPGALDGKFDSGNLAQNATVCVQFLSAGTYQYFCNIHVFMTGAVSVQ